MTKHAVLAILIALVLLSSCTFIGGGKREQALTTEFRTGTQGLTMRFLPSLPPQRLFDNEGFVAMLEVENRGSFPIGGGIDRVYLSGFDPSLITGVPIGGEPLLDIEGRSVFNPNQGGIDTVEFRANIRPLGPQTDKYATTLLATACYGYKTVATANVCIDPDPFSRTSEQKACVAGGTTSLGSQGAPVAVTQVQIEPSPSRTVFRIFIQNVGGGTPIRDVTLLNKCSPYDAYGLEFDEVEYVSLESVEVAGVQPRCKPQQEIRLTNGQGIIVCHLDHSFGRAAAFYSPLNIVLRYGYRSTIQTPLEVVASRGFT
ncbi:hypothetical protein J4410_04175 [Candidatus Woesearchaeota archaeon]|nr:hypothetical protein [Candidatus Woesearchaeota archaeon]